MGTIHSDTREDFNCPLCPKIYISKIGLNLHLTRRHDKPSTVKSRKPPTAFFHDLNHPAEGKVLNHPEPQTTEVLNNMEMKHLEVPSSEDSEPIESVKSDPGEANVMKPSLPAFEPLEASNSDLDDANLSTLSLPTSEPLEAIKSDPENMTGMVLAMPASVHLDLSHQNEPRAVTNVKAEEPIREEVVDIYQELFAQESPFLNL